MFPCKGKQQLTYALKERYRWSRKKYTRKDKPFSHTESGAPFSKQEGYLLTFKKQKR